MSSKKTSKGTLVILFFLLFAGVAAAGWYYVGQQKAQPEATTTEQVASDHEVTEGDHSHGPDTHTHDDNMQQSRAVQVGDAGTVYDLGVKPLLGRRGVGDPNAPVHVREFFSLTCNHCADFYTGAYQNIKQQFIDTGKLYFIYEEFPLNGPALYGSMIARCLPEERYEGFVDLLLRGQEEWAFSGDFKAALMQNAKLAGMTEEEFETCYANTELQKEIATNIKEASDAWKVSSTPTFVFNNGERILRGAHTTEDFGTVISILTEGASAETNADETSEAAPSPNVENMDFEQHKKYDEEWYRAKAENVLENPDPSTENE